MEGISHEACSLAATLGLNKLIAFWDENGISIDGEISGWFTDDTPARFEAYGWLVIRDVDGHDPVEIRQAIETALGETQRPTLICCRTVIGFGSPAKQGSAASHGAPLGDEEVAAAREAMSWPHPPFEIPEAVYAAWDARDRGAAARQAWEARWTAYAAAYPEPAAEYDRRMRGALPTGWEAETSAAIAQLQADGKDMATRKASQLALESFAPLLPELIGGSADLAGSNNTIWSGSKNVLEGQGEGNYVYFGVREFGMTALCNGLALHGGFIPYNATFLVFSDYARNAVRMSAMMGAHNIHIYTHDSIGLGEDGPTHQPVEHVTSLRLMPNLSVWRPCDAVESAVAWKLALEEKHQPHALIFSRQGLPAQSRSEAQLALIQQGGYILADSDGTPDVILIATGSEVQLIVEAAKQLADSGIAARVVSMPNPERFLQQDAAYTESVLPAAVTSRVAVEAGSTLFWHRLVGDRGQVIGIDSFGASAPATDLFEHFGINALAVVDAASKSLNT
jgi:transketolase